MDEAPIEPRNIKGGGGQKSGRRVGTTVADAFFLHRKKKQTKETKAIARTNTFLKTLRRSCTSKHARQDAVPCNSDHFRRSEQYRIRYEIEDAYNKEPQQRQRKETTIIRRKVNFLEKNIQQRTFYYSYYCTTSL